MEWFARGAVCRFMKQRAPQRIQIADDRSCEAVASFSLIACVPGGVGDGESRDSGASFILLEACEIWFIPLFLLLY